MNNKQVKNRIETILLQDDRLWNEDKTELNQTLLLDLVEKIDEKIIELLLKEKVTREKFFVKVRDVYVFKTNDFKFFMEENKVDNSYTKYKNRIGLTDGKRFLKDSGDVVLDFPFKDCVLEGGQSTEEGFDTYFEYEDEKTKTIKGKKITEPAGYKEKKAKRKEIFFNQVLAQDEIDRLFDEKALVNWKRYTKEGERKVDKIKRDENGIIKENLVIKGNNLLALHSLKKQFAGKVKLIYIDPPYNTGGDANTFAYNNTFNHSSWLTFMRNRLEVAKDLLRNDGVISIAIDDEEQAHLKVLCDEIFNRENYIGTIIVQSNPRGRTTNAHFATTHEYSFFYCKNINKVTVNYLKLTKEQEADFKYKDEGGKYRLLPFRRSGGTSTPEERPNSYYPIYYNEIDESFSLNKNEWFIEIFPIDSLGKKRVWRQTKPSFLKAVKRGDMVCKKSKGKFTLYMKDRIKDGRKPKTIWYDSKYDASSSGTILLKNIFDGEKLFSYPKSIHTVKDTLEIITKCENNDIILDFFGGSGTTAHAVLKSNKEDGGNRKFILVEQMDYINTVTCPRVQKVMEKENIDGSFIYFELAKWNENAKEEILACNSLKELEKLFNILYEKYFLNYNLKIKEFKEKVIKEDNFKNLSLDEQKRMFLTMLDLNQMYVQKTEMADKKFGISKEDQKMTAEFYCGE